ncbi:unnamed protein product [Lepeophtheirus salmonis]|uniref:(salmon louse) hypothetical protein n=1 Tax=Lepeophtheirus salmonis TaxID=72036 RepID=A0A7R8CM50_LEPSM|nr:unnamed protein product [Lepeophtheirus salmonis]CAF2828790.1 unnamed protein product [Lepeophtheirus salmonis]
MRFLKLDLSDTAQLMEVSEDIILHNFISVCPSEIASVLASCSQDSLEVMAGTDNSSKPLYISDNLMKSNYAWFRLDRVKNLLEAPYTGPAKLLKPAIIKENCSLKRSPTNIERISGSISSPNETTPFESTGSQTTSRSRRRIRFSKNPDYHYF